MFENAKLKIERADHHITDAESLIRQFVTTPNGISIQPDRAGTSFTITVEQPPKQIALTISDAIHNLRTALDHLAWSLIGRDGGTQDRHLKFPMGDNRTNFESSCQGIKTPSQSIKNMLKAFEAFPGGKGDTLYVLHTLDNADKHTIVTPIMRVSRFKKILLQDSAGKTLGEFIGARNFKIEPGTTITIDASWLAEISQIGFESDTDISTEVLFGKIKFAERQSIFSTLVQLREAVVETVKITESSIS